MSSKNLTDANGDGIIDLSDVEILINDNGKMLCRKCNNENLINKF